MKPGRELDALIAERVMGWKKRSDGRWDMNKIGEGHVIGDLPKFSEDINDAQMVVDKILKADPSFPREEYTEAHAICRAALEALTKK